MSYYVQLPDGRDVEFPDNFPRAQAQAIAARMSAPARQEQVAEPTQQRQPTNFLLDVPGAIVSGVGGLGTAAGGIYGLISGDFDNAATRAGRYVQNVGRDIMSPGLRQRQDEFEQRMISVQDQGLGTQAVEAVRRLASDPYLFGSMAVEQIPQLAASLGIGRVGGAVGQIAARRAGVEASEQAARRGATGAAIGASTGLQTGEVANSTYQDVMRLAPEVIERSASYQELRRTMTDQEARENLATRAAREASLIAAPLSAASATLLPGVERMAFAQRAQQSALSRILGGAIFEGGQEAIEEGGGRFAQNVGARRADEDRNLGQGVGSAAATGAAIGAGIGGGFAALRGGPPPSNLNGDNLPPELRQAIGEYVGNREPLSEGQLRLPRETPDIETPVGNLSRSQLLRFMERRLPGMVAEDPEIASRMSYARNENERLDAFREILQQQQGGNVTARQGTEEGNIRREMATSPETQRAFRNAEVQQRMGVKPVSVQELRRDLTVAEQQVKQLIDARLGAERRLAAIEQQPVTDLAAREATQAEIAQLNQLIAGREQIRREIANSIPVTERQNTAAQNREADAQSAFDIVQARRDRQAQQEQADGIEVPTGTVITQPIGPNRVSVPELETKTVDQPGDDARAGRPKLTEMRYVLNPQYSGGRLVGGEAVVEILPTDDAGGVLAYVRRQNGQITETVPVETTMDQLAQLPVRETARMTQEASGAAVGPDQIAGSRGRGVDAEGQTLQPRRMVDRQDPQASARPAQGEQAQQQAEPTETDARASRRVAAQNRINALYLNKLKDRGRQGRLLRNALVDALKDRTLTADQVYAAFVAADVMSQILPAGADHQVQFVRELLAPTDAAERSGGVAGQQVQGLRFRPNQQGVLGLIQLSLAPNQMPILRETAAHEAFHVLQDYYGKFDPQFAKLMSQGFRDGMMIADVDPTIRRKLEQARFPNSNASYWQTLTSSLPNAMNAREAQAYAFGALMDASRRGTPMTGLKPAFARFVSFLRQFSTRMGNTLRGDGFQTVEDLMGRVAQGDARRFDDRATPTGQDFPNTGVQASAQPGAAQQPQFSARSPLADDSAFQATLEKITGKDLDKPNVFSDGLRRFAGALPGEKISSALIRTAVNRVAPLWMMDRLAKEKGLTLRSAGLAMEVALNNSGRVQMYLEHGPLAYDPKTGNVSIREDAPGLIDAIKGRLNVQDKREAQSYLVSLRERDLRRNGKKGFFTLTDAEVDQIISKSEAAHPEWKGMASDIQRINKALLDFAVSTGTLDRSKADQLASMFYTPFYRQAEDDAKDSSDTAIGPRLSDSLTNVKTAFDVKLKGGVNPLGDLFENMIRNADVIMKAGMKNVAMRQAAETMGAVGLGREAKAREAGKTITYRVDGQDKHFEVDDAVLYTTLAGAPREFANGIYQTMANFAGFFRDMITIAPSFMLANLWRGKTMAYVQEGVPFTANTFDGLRQALKASTSYKAIAAQTGFGGYTYGMGERDATKAFEREIKGLGYGPGGMMRRAFDALQKASEATEMAERIKLYERMKAQGMTDKEAAYQAYLLAPFSRRGMGGGWLGSTVNWLVPLVPFLNAKIQGMYRLYENEKDDTQKLWTLGLPKQIFLRGLVVTGASLALAAKSMTDEPERWDNETPDIKRGYDILYLPGGGRLLFPRAFDVGNVFGTIPVFIMDAFRRNDGRDIAKMLSDVGTSTFFFNPIPQALVPILGATMNYDLFRGRALENAGDQSKLPEERVNRSTSTVARLAGEAAGVSPIRIQAVLEGYSGTIGTSVLAGFDSILAGMGLIPNKPAGAFGDPLSMPAVIAGLTGASRFYRSDDQVASRFVGDFYKIKEQVEQLNRSLTGARERGDTARITELQGQEGIPLRLRPMVNNANRQLSTVNEQMRRLEQQRLSSEELAERLKPLRERRDMITRRVVERARELGM